VVSQLEGTGIGPALVRRIVERYGGSVQAYAQLGVGATLSFSLPVAEEDGVPV
jgi:signal transduction histidine kinase